MQSLRCLTKLPAQTKQCKVLDVLLGCFVIIALKCHQGADHFAMTSVGKQSTILKNALCLPVLHDYCTSTNTPSKRHPCWQGLNTA